MTGLGRGKAIVVRMSSSTKDVGFSSTVLATVFSIIYFVGQLAEWAGLLGSQGGPSSSSTPLGLVLLLSPAFFLGSSFLVMVVSIHQFASSDKRIWGHTAVVFASARAILVSTVYFVQLTLAAPRAARGRVAGIEGLLFVPFDSVLYAVNILSYNFMRVGTSFAVPVFTGGGEVQRVARRLLIPNGLLLPFIALQLYFHQLIWVAALWAVTFPGSTWTLAVLFGRADTTEPAWQSSGPGYDAGMQLFFWGPRRRGMCVGIPSVTGSAD
jgi:hypothetical protein